MSINLADQALREAQKRKNVVMDLSKFEMKDLVVSALKSEVEAEKLYLKLASRISNFMLKDRMEFLAQEEKKHATFFADLHKKLFGQDAIDLPDHTPVPLPDVTVEGDSQPISDVLAMAMEAEKAASDFYTSWAERYAADAAEDESDPYIHSPAKMRKMLLYVASMEMGHFKLLEIERDRAIDFEAEQMQWNLDFVGP